MHSHTGSNVCVNTRVAQAMQTRVSPRTRGKALPPRKLHEDAHRAEEGGRGGRLNVLHTALNNETHEGGGTCTLHPSSWQLYLAFIRRIYLPVFHQGCIFPPPPLSTITPTEYRNLWMDGRVEGRRRLEEFRRERKSRAPLVNLGECTRGKGEGVESVMSRNLGVPRIYSRWRGGSTNRACREFAIVIYEYAGWFVLWTRLAATADISVFLSVCCRGHACAAILCQWSFDRMYGVVRGQCRRWNELK